LRNAIRTMLVMSDSEVLDVRDIPPEIHQVRQLPGQVAAAGNLGGVSLNELEKQAITDTLAKVANNRELAAKLLGIGERTLYRKIKEYNIQ
jgi:DNA-binding NtrC family response regulator